MVRTPAIALSHIEVRGVVQGVGFRPFVYRLAHAHHLHGWVRNTSGAVCIEAEGNPQIVRRFVEALKAQAPAAAQIEELNFSRQTGRL